jgi:hypothetical protein
MAGSDLQPEPRINVRGAEMCAGLTASYAGRTSQMSAKAHFTETRVRRRSGWVTNDLPISQASSLSVLVIETAVIRGFFSEAQKSRPWFAAKGTANKERRRR